MAFYENGLVRICYEDLGTGAPLLLIAGGGLNGTIQNLTDKSPFNPVEQFSSKYRCIMMDLRNANTGKSSGPLEIERPWDAYSDDQIILMDHLGIDKFMVLGFCIGGPLFGIYYGVYPIEWLLLYWFSQAVFVPKYPIYFIRTILKVGRRSYAKAAQTFR